MTNINDELIYFRKSQKAKHVIFKINPLKGIEIVVPRGVTRSQLSKLVLEKSQSVWFEKAVSQLHKYRRQLTPSVINLGYEDKCWMIRYDKSVKVSHPSIYEVESGVLQININKIDSIGHIKLLQEWLQFKAENILLPLVRNISQSTNISFNSVRVKSQKTSWGTCSVRKNINLNRNLIFLPRNLVEYVILHELCHVKFMNHSLEFWKALETYVPDCKAAKRELNESGKILTPAWALI